MQQIASSAPSSPQMGHHFREAKDCSLDSLEQHSRMISILEDMVSNSRVVPCRRRYTVTTLIFAFLIASTSFTCYGLLRKYLFLPSYSFLHRYFRPELNTVGSYVTDISKLPDYLECLSQQLGEKMAEISQFGGFLAVDAMSLRPHVFVTKNGLVQGLLENEFLDDAEVTQMKTNYEEYERYVASLRNKTITDSFIYQYQPLSASARCFTVFIEPSTQGKATGSQIDRLNELALLLTEYGFPVQGFAFDGDTTYARLHGLFFNAYNKKISQSTDFNNFSVIEDRSIVSDPLHLIKRARYRLLSCFVHGDFENVTTSLISVDLLKKELDLPSVVFSDASYTKMQDDLAVRLFSLKTIAYLFEMRNYSVLSYFLPICLLCVSLEERNLQVNDKISLLELGFYYMLAYNNMLMELKSQLPQKKSRTDKHVCPFDASFAREYCNTVCSILQVLYKMNGTVGINRIGSNPVEHLFGLIRMKSHSVHTYDKMLQVMTKSLLQQRFIHEMGEGQRIDRRLSDFAKDVANRPSAIKNTLNISPRDLAFTFHCVFGFPVSVTNLLVWDATSLFDLRNETFETFRGHVLWLFQRCGVSNEHRLTSTEVKVTKGTQIKGRLIDQKVVS